MEAMNGNVKKVHILRLDPGELLLESIHSYLNENNIKNAYVASGIGTLSDCILHMVTTTGFPPIEHFEHWYDKPLELASLSGIVADGIGHLHTVISDCEKAYAGHVEPGCKVLYLAEIVILEIDVPMKRFVNEINLKQLMPED